MKKTLLMLALVAGITSFAQNATAAIVNINIGPTGFNIGGINGGVANNSNGIAEDFPISGNSLYLANNHFGIFTGLGGAVGITIAGPVTESPARPFKFSLNDPIGVGSAYAYNGNGYYTAFKWIADVSPDFGAGSYMGFKTSQGNYGWLEVTWTASSSQFQILSGAYESTPNVAILAGAGPGPAPVPEPGTWAAAALLAGGAGFMRWRKRKQVS